jgi:hypothetical protein
MPPLPTTKERDWQATLVAALEVFGYVVEHTYPLRTQHGWRTGSTLTGKPDLIALRPPRLLAIECKTDKGRLTTEQVAVLSLYALVPCCRAWVLRPRDPWDTVQSWLRRPKLAPVTYGFEPMPQLDAYRVVASRTQRVPR